MTSRPALAVQQRQPTRSMSGGPPTRQSAPPPHQRTLSQSYLPHDLTGDVAPRNGGPGLLRGGSRLKLELSSNEPFAQITPLSDSPTAADSSKAFTPSRIMSMADASSDLGVLSPHNPNRVLPGGMSMLDLSAEPPLTPLPMPRRRPRFPVPDARRNATPTPPPNPIKKDARPRPWAIETPSSAPKYHNRSADPHAPGASARGSITSTRSGPSTAASTAQLGHCADFFPWVGDHPEDQFSHKTITEGYFERAPTQHEHASAKSYISQALKQNRGLQGLSWFYSDVLRNRRDIGQVAAPPSFKPPPRVTLTDTKREVWLKDLANPAITLRRLSRTIPHGIRGRILLDQCLNKKVPAERAVWLAKCVGANEIRAVKRKGTGGALAMGGEGKWIRDWTICVEQFVEATVLSVTSPDWKWRADYAIRLARHLFCADLLDKDHYLEWLVSGLEASNLTKLPLWIIIAQIHWKDILRLRKYGQKLVSAVADHLLSIQHHADRDVFQSLEQLLSSAVQQLMLMGPESFISPSTWPRHKHTILDCLPSDDSTLQATFRMIDTRNEQLAATCIRSQPAARSVLVKILDNTLHSPVPEDLSSRCLAITRDVGAIARSLLEWATSLQRPGAAKIYVATRLLDSWVSLPGFDVTETVLAFIVCLPATEENGRKELIFHLVAELIRMDLFSIQRYIGWLIARGGIKQPRDVEPDGPADARLLVELPVNEMNDSLQNIRASMLRRATYPIADQKKEVENAIEITKQLIGVATKRHSPTMSLQKFTKRLAKASFQVKLQVSLWLRSALADIIKSYHGRDDDDDDDGIDDKEPLGGISDVLFCNIRRILEACQDFRILAEVLDAVVPLTASADVLASYSDTLMMHTQVFAAMGQLEPLTEMLLVRLSLIVSEETGPGVRRLLASFAALACRIPGKEELATKLSLDLTRYDRSSAIDACSPVSDNNPDGDLREEEAIERLFSSGTSVDKQTMERLFDNLIDRLKPDGEDNQAPEKLRGSIGLLSRLRVFDSEQFDMQMTKWLQSQIQSANRTSILSVYPLMISLGCLSMPLLLSALFGEGQTGKVSCPASLAATNMTAVPPLTHQEILQLVLRPLSERSSASLATDERYRFQISQSLAPRTNPEALLAVIRMALSEYAESLPGEKAHMPLADKVLRASLRVALTEMTLVDSNMVARILLNKQGNVNQVAAILERELERILLPDKTATGNSDQDESAQVSFEQILELTNELTLPFCQLKLRASLAADSPTLPGSSGGEPTQRLQAQLDLFAMAMDKAIDAGNITWTGMLSCLNPEITQHLKNKAQARFLDLLPSPEKQTMGSTPMDVDTTEDDVEESAQMAERMLAVLDTIMRGGSFGRPLQLAAVVVEKLMDLWEILATTPTSAAQRETREAIQRHWLPHMLTFLTMHTTALDTTKPSVEVRARAVLALSGIMVELGGTTWADSVSDPPGDEAGPAALTQRVFDLALVLVDHLPEDVRASVARVLLGDGSADPRLRYMLSWIPEPTADRHFLVWGGGPEAKRSTSAAASQAPTAPPEAKGRLFQPRRWELLNEPMPNVGENDSSLSLTLFKAFKLQ